MYNLSEINLEMIGLNCEFVLSYVFSSGNQENGYFKCTYSFKRPLNDEEYFF